MTLDINRLAEHVLAEVARRDRNRDEAAQPSELVELTPIEIAALRAERDRNRGFTLPGNAGPPTFCGLLIREVAEVGPLRVKSRAEVMLERRQPLGPPVFFSNPR